MNIPLILKQILEIIIDKKSKLILFLVPSITTALLVISFAESIDKLITIITNHILRFLRVNSFKISIFIYYIVAFLVILGIYVTNYKIISILIEYYSNNSMGDSDPKGENIKNNSKQQSSNEEKFDCKETSTESKASTYSYKYTNQPVTSQEDIINPVFKHNYQYQRYCIKRNYTKIFKRDWNKKKSKKYHLDNPPIGIFKDNLEASLYLKYYKIELAKISNNFSNLSKSDKVKYYNDFHVFVRAIKIEGLGDKYIPKNNVFSSILGYRNSYISKTEIKPHNARVKTNLEVEKFAKTFI